MKNWICKIQRTIIELDSMYWFALTMIVVFATTFIVGKWSTLESLKKIIP